MKSQQIKFIVHLFFSYFSCAPSPFRFLLAVCALCTLLGLRWHLRCGQRSHGAFLGLRGALIVVSLFLESMFLHIYTVRIYLFKYKYVYTIYIYIHYKCQCQFQSPTSHWQQEDLMQASSFARVEKGKALTTAQTPISRTKSQGRIDRIREGRCSWHLVSRDMLLLVLLLSYYYPNFMATHGNRSSLAKDRA